MNTTHNHTSTSDFPIAIALLALMSISLLIISYYIFIIKSCFNIHTLDPLRRFSFPRNTPNPNLSTINPAHTNEMFLYQNRGLDEWLINNIPAFPYKQESCTRTSISCSYGEHSFRSGCAVCLNEFHDQEMLRILPRCSHIFHLDCIDVWLLNNASCPLCRSSISGRTRYPIDHIIAPSSSPIHNDHDFVVIELEHNNGDIVGESHRKYSEKTNNGSKVKRFSIMGDECIDVNRVKDEQFCVEQPIRRSFSMDSVVDRGLYLHVQEMITRQNRVVNGNNQRNQVDNDHVNGYNLGSNEEGQSNGRFRRGSFFSFGHSRGSSRSSSILPLEMDR